MTSKNIRYTPEGLQENEFRLEVRDALDLDIFARNDQIIEKIKFLMRMYGTALREVAEQGQMRIKS